MSEITDDIAYNAGLEIRYAIAASGTDPIQHIPEVDAIIERRLAEARRQAFAEAADEIERLTRELSDLQARAAKWDEKDGIDGAACSMIRETLDEFGAPRAAFIDDHVANGLLHARRQAFTEAAALIEGNIIKDTNAGKALAPRQKGNREGLHYAHALRAKAESDNG